MARRSWTVIAGATMVVLLAVGLAGAAFYVQYQKSRERAAFADGTAAYERGNFSEARMYLGYYLEDNRDDADALLKYANACMKLLPDRASKLNEATQAYIQIEHVRPGDPEAIRNIIEIQVQKRAWQDLEYYADTYLAGSPSDPMLKFHRALAYDRLDRFEEAETAYKMLLAEDTPYIECFFNLARLYDSRNFTGEAAQVFTDGFAMKPDDPALRGQYARFLLLTRKFDLAKEEIDKALAKLPDDAQVLTVASQEAMAQERWDDAIGYAARAIATGDAEAEACLATIVAYERKRQIPDAIAFIDAMDDLKRIDSPEIFMTQVELLTIANRLPEADTVLDEYRKVYVDHFSVVGYLEARLLLARGNAKKAATQLTSVVETKPDFRQAQFYLIIAMLESNDLERAQVNLQSYLRSYPGDAQASSLLATKFGTGQTLANATRSADRLLGDADATAQALIAAATSLYQQSTRTNALAANGPKIFDLLTKAIEKDPMVPESYSVMVELLTYQGDLERAEAIMNAAIEKGVPAESTRLPRAAILLSKKDTAGAEGIYVNEVLGGAHLTVNDVIRWAEFLARRSSIDIGLSALEKAIPKVPAEDGASVVVEPVSLCIRLNDLDRAREILAALEKRPAGLADILTMLRDQKVALILAYIRNDSAKNPQAALELVRELDAASPGDVDNQVLLARVLMRLEPPDMDGAKKVAEALLVANASNPGVVATLATLAMERQDYKAALEYAEQATLLDPTNLQTQLALAELQLKLNFNKDAIASLERARAVDPSSLRVLELLAEAYLKDGDLPNAEAAAQNVVSRAELDAPELEDRLKLLLSRIQIDKGENLEEATESLRKRYTENPGDLGAANDLVVALTRQNKMDEAEETLNGYVESHANNADAWVTLGRFYLSRQRTADASRSLSRALILNRDQPDALRTMISLQIGQGDKAGVIDLIDRYLGMQPNDADIWYRKALLLAQSGEQDPAKEAAGKAIGIEPTYDRLYLRAVLRLQDKQFQSALDDLEAAVELYPPSSPAIELAFAKAHFGLHDIDSARRYFKNASQRAAKDDASLQAEIAAFGAQLDAAQ